MLLLYKTLVRPHVEYSISAWSPYYVKNKNQIEKVQRRFTKMIPELHGWTIGLTYENRLKALKLWTPEERRNRADLIEVRYSNCFEESLLCHSKNFSSCTWIKETEVTQ